ncbi:MAG: translation initiation factor IF-2 subunit alpha [Candidatus Micrarchaeota archaeon]
MAGYPESGEYVIATVKKMMPYGAFCSLDEYGDLEAFLHISEVSSGWVKNIREFVKEGQKIVALISNVDESKRQIDLSLKRVSDSDRKRKLESFQQSKRAEKWLERAAIKLNRNPKDSLKEIGDMLTAEYGDIYTAFDAIRQGIVKEKVPPAWVGAIKEIAAAEIKQKEVRVRAKLRLQCNAENGVEVVKAALTNIEKAGKGVSVHYLGAPNYYFDITAGNFKDAEKTLSKIELQLGKEKGIDFAVEKQKD